MAVPRTSAEQIVGELESSDGALRVEVVRAARHTLLVQFLNGRVPPSGTLFAGLRLVVDDRQVRLGPCRYEAHANGGQRRRIDDAKLVGHGRLVFTTSLYDFANLWPGGAAIDLKKKLEQLPVMWGRKEAVRPEFRGFTAELVYDLQVYRGIFDEVDRNLVDEPRPVREQVHQVVTDAEYPAFCSLFDAKLAELEAQVKTFTKEEHERHGFYFRKHVWDIILASEFLTRTNLKPRGYAGDSVMMRMVYEDQFRGPTIFSRFVHRHPVQTRAAQAVRNRRALIRDRLEGVAGAAAGGEPTRVMSVACGPAWELRDLFSARDAFGRYRYTLLDQDLHALAEARSTVFELQERFGETLQGSLVRESVRTMLRTGNLADRWGQFDFVYSMGLFDYLTTPVARAVLAKLYGLLAPGGELVVGNFHSKNPTRTYMEYWMDWVLVYRDEEEFFDMARNLPGARPTLVFEDTGSQMFLCIRKEA